MSKRSWIRFAVLLALATALTSIAALKLVQSSQSAGGSNAETSERPAARVTTRPADRETLYDTLSVVGTLHPEDRVAVRNETPGKLERLHFEDGQRVRRGQPLVQMRNASLRAELAIAEERRDFLAMAVDRAKAAANSRGISRYEVDSRQSDLAVARAEVDRLEAQLDETIVRAPFDGVIGLTSVSEGSILSGPTDIAELRKVDALHLRFGVPERFAHAIEQGQPVRFQVHGSGDIRSAAITALESGISEDTRALRVQADVDNADGSLLAGSSVRAHVILETREDVVTVPAPAVIISSEGATVWVDDGGAAAKRAVEVGHRTDRRVEIASGLAAGTPVVVTGQHALAEGQSLDASAPEGAPALEAIGPEGTTPGMRNQWLSEEEFEAQVGAASDEEDAE